MIPNSREDGGGILQGQLGHHALCGSPLGSNPGDPRPSVVQYGPSDPDGVAADKASSPYDQDPQAVAQPFHAAIGVRTLLRVYYDESLT